jgi:small-conductance mechanosensitive channel
VKDHSAAFSIVKHLKRNLPALAITILLAACIVAIFLTRDERRTRAEPKSATSRTARPVDERQLKTAQALAALADTTDEQNLAREALRLSDHEYDVAFASALRDAVTNTAPATPELKRVVDRINQLKKQIAATGAVLANLSQESGKADDGSRLALAKAQLSLDEDELVDAQEDLIRRGGDRRATLERILKEHEAAQRQSQPAKTLSPSRTGTLGEQLQVWQSLRSRKQQLRAADKQASEKAVRLTRGHDALEHFIHNEAPAEDITPARLERFRQLSDRSKTLADLDKRIQDSQQLADVYKRWEDLVDKRQRDVRHLVLVSLAGILTVLLAVVLIDQAIRYAFLRHRDRRRMHQLRVMATVAVQVIGGVIVLFIIFGFPTQITTIIGLTTAGLTVVLRDFIVAFFGWFALMGKNGIHIGDWVEIEGVGGEVIEIGILKTVLLEMGNWTNTGHPTGRRVAFVNKFAIENHYFNFSTAGQWLWDELRMTLPDTRNAYELATEIRARVEQETENDARVAEQDWERVTRQYGTSPFSAKPAVDLQPSASGLEVVVRYITRAPQRYEVKSRLLQAVVDLVHKQARETPSIPG